jgi:hypothetical protein
MQLHVGLLPIHPFGVLVAGGHRAQERAPSSGSPFERLVPGDAPNFAQRGHARETLSAQRLAAEPPTIWMDSHAPNRDDAGLSTRRCTSMGDKSPKAKEKAKKQDTAGKDQKKASAAAKVAQQGAAGAAKKGR